MTTWADGTFSVPEPTAADEMREAMAAVHRAQREAADEFAETVATAVGAAQERGCGVLVNRTARTAEPSRYIPAGEVYVVSPPTLEEVAADMPPLGGWS